MQAEWINTKALLRHLPWDDTPANRAKICDSRKGLHVFFRRVKTQLQARFAQIVNHATLPQVFILGSPHIDNYARTDFGCGMIDFDRSHNGPYAWDLFCFMLSLSLRHVDGLDNFIDSTITKKLLENYQQAIENPEKPYLLYQPLVDKTLKPWQSSPLTYLEANKKWIKKMREQPLEINEPLLQSLVEQYFQHRDEVHRGQHCVITEAGQAAGSFGRVHYIIVLASPEQEQPLILDIKHTKHYLNPLWPHNQWYSHPFEHEGQRMIAASNNHAPGVSGEESYATLNGIEYWARNIPVQTTKIKGQLDSEQQQQLAAAVGSQLGRAHALSINAVGRKELLQHSEKQFSEICAAAAQLQQELLDAWKHYSELADQHKLIS